ncbi:MAG TPA: serine hydrolase domain-containing protein [Pirellulaceae bacterium]|nr:serine hydrolase domain-containing protein [Pirellulaceae bacterium]
MTSGSDGSGAASVAYGTAFARPGDGIARIDRPIDEGRELSLCRRASAPVREAVACGTFAGAVTGVLLPDGTTQFEAYGSAVRETGQAMAPDSLFWIASLTKSMTSTLVLMLVDEGKLALEDPVERHLPEFRGQTVAGWFGKGSRPRRPAMVADLMRHLSGMPDRVPSEMRPLDRIALAEKARLCGSLRLVSQPGEKHLYSNLNYEALGRLIEVASGASFEAFLQERLLDPLGMRDTTFRPMASQLARLALPYQTRQAPNTFFAARDGASERRPFTLVREPFDDAVRQPTPAFGLFSTAEDCLRFCRLHLQGGERQRRRLFSAGSAELLLKRFDGPPGAESQGLAWSVSPNAAVITGTMGTWMTLHLRIGVASVFLSSCADFWDGPRDVCKRFVGNVGAEVRAERTAEIRRAADARRASVNRRRRVRQPVEG